MNSNTKFRSLSAILFLLFLSVSIGSVHAFIVFPPPGGGGGSTLSAPTLYNPSSDQDGYIHLDWNDVYLATSYSIHRSESETGPYSQITTTQNHYFKDFPPSFGEYWYKVKAHSSSSSSGYSNIESCEGGPNPLYLDSLTIDYGIEGTGVLINTVTDDSNYKQYNSECLNTPLSLHILHLDLNFYPDLNGGDYYLSLHIESNTDQTVNLLINEETLESSTNIDFDNIIINDLTSIEICGDNFYGGFGFLIYHIKLIPAQPLPDHWYDSNERYDLGNYPNNEWNYFEGDLGIVQANHYGVNMRGKAMRFTDPGGSEYSIISRNDRYFDIPSDQALLLSFKGQSNGGGTAAIYLRSETEGDSEYLLGIAFCNDGDIQFGFAVDNFSYFDYDAFLGQVYDIDVFISKEAETDLVYYYVYVNQELIYVESLTTQLVVLQEQVMVDADSFLLDEYFLGYTDFEIFPEETRDIGIPMYYLFAPQILSDNIYIDKMNLWYEYEFSNQTTSTYGLYLGPTLLIFDMTFDLMLPEIVNDYENERYSVGTNNQDRIIFHHIVINVTDIIFTLPGEDPDLGTDALIGWHEGNLISEAIMDSSVDYFYTLIEEYPQEFYDCKNNLLKIETETLYVTTDGNTSRNFLLAEKEIETKQYYGMALGIGGAPEGVGGSIGFSFSTESISTITARVLLEIEWVNLPDPEPGQQIGVTFDTYETPQEFYSDDLILPPFYINQIEEIIIST